VVAWQPQQRIHHHPGHAVAPVGILQPAKKSSPMVQPQVSGSASVVVVEPSMEGTVINLSHSTTAQPNAPNPQQEGQNPPGSPSRYVRAARRCGCSGGGAGWCVRVCHVCGVGSVCGSMVKNGMKKSKVECRRVCGVCVQAGVACTGKVAGRR